MAAQLAKRLIPQNEDMGPGKRIAALRKEKGLSGRALARMAGISQGLISQIETGYISSLSAEKMSAVARALGTTTEYLLHGGRSKSAKSATFANAWDIDQNTDLSWVQFFLIPSISLREVNLLKNHPKGRGVEGVNYDRTVAVSADMVRQQSLEPGRLLAIEADGDAMSPRIVQGDQLIVNTADTKIVDGKIYLLHFGDQSRILRAFGKSDGRIMLRPDNANYPSLDVDAESIRVIGRVTFVQSPV